MLVELSATWHRTAPDKRQPDLGMGKTWAESLTPSWLIAARGTPRAATRGAQGDTFMSEAKQHVEDAARKSHCAHARTKMPACLGRCVARGSLKTLQGQILHTSVPAPWAPHFWPWLILWTEAVSLQGSGRAQ